MRQKNIQWQFHRYGIMSSEGDDMYNFRLSYFQFPKWNDACEEAEVIRGDTENLRAVILDDIIHSRRDGIELRIRILIPESLDENARYPLLLHVKGSGWDHQNLGSLITDMADIVRAGYAIGFVQYRSWQQAHYPAQVIDLKTAARYVYQNAEDLHIDPSAIFLSGDSSGGHTAIMAYLTWKTELLDDPEDQRPLPDIRGLIDFYGVSSLSDLCHQETGLSQSDNALLAPMLFGEGINEDSKELAIADFQSYLNLRDNLEPFIALHGNRDRLVPLSHSIELYRALKKRGVQCSIVIVDEADHGHSIFWCNALKKRLLEYLRKNTAE